jgi:hypothetical protein
MKGGYLIIDCGGAKLDTITAFPAGTFAKITSCKGKPILLNNFILTSNGQPTGAFGAVTITSSKYEIDVVAGGSIYTLLVESDDDVTASKASVNTGTLPNATKSKAGVVKMADCHQSWEELDALTGEATIADITMILNDLYDELISAGIISKT